MSIIETAPVYVEPVAPDAVGEALEQAADLIAERGWAQHVTFKPTGEMCARGAILHATLGHQDLPLAAEERLRQRLGVFSVVSWNDEPGRTAGQVIRALKEAAAA